MRREALGLSTLHEFGIRGVMCVTVMLIFVAKASAPTPLIGVDDVPYV